MFAFRLQFVLVTALCLMVSSTCVGQDLFGDLHTTGLADGPSDSAVATTASGTNDAANDDVTIPYEVMTKLMNDKYPELTREEFIAYLKVVETMNPFSSWKQIATRLHAKAYPEDSTRKAFGVGLFKEGEENEGWEKVSLPGTFVPKFVIGHGGDKIDIAHTYAALRAGLNRGGVKRWWMARVNTEWGDNYQVSTERLKGVGTIIGGIFTFNKDRIGRGADRWSHARNYKTPAQARGNELGLKLQKYIIDLEDEEPKLSAAYHACLFPEDLQLPEARPLWQRALLTMPMGPIMPNPYLLRSVR